MTSNLLPDFRPVSYSRVTLTELMIPSYANFGGKIHGGILLSLMDKVAYAAASKHAGTYCVTVSVTREYDTGRKSGRGCGGIGTARGVRNIPAVALPDLCKIRGLVRSGYHAVCLPL